MIATVRALTGAEPARSTSATAPTRRESTRARPGRRGPARVPHAGRQPASGSPAIKRHGYKGAFEMAATVDYLFGYDATAQVVDDWMYERVTEAYVFDQDVRQFFEEKNPWALRASSSGCSRRSSAASGRRRPTRSAPAQLEQIYLEIGRAARSARRQTTDADGSGS